MPAGRVRLIAALLLLGGFGLGTLFALWGTEGSEPTANSDSSKPADGAALLPPVDPASDVASTSAAPAAGIDDPRLTSAEPARIELGRSTYAQHCASCHGLQGEGQADWKIPNEDGSLPAPPHDVSGHTWHHADAQLLEIIAQGGTVYMPESTMPGFANLLSQAEMEAVLAYIKRWWGPDELDFQAEVSASWPTAEAP